jgi:hypothetical protein
MHRINPIEFCIILKPEPKLDEKKAIYYRCHKPDDASEIMAKLRFLTTHNNTKK